MKIRVHCVALCAWVVVVGCGLLLMGPEKAVAAPRPGGAMPIRLPEQNDPEIRKIQKQFYGLAQTQARYLLSTVRPSPANPGHKCLADSSEPRSDWVRRNGAAVQSFAFLYRFGPYDEKIVGVSRKALLEEYIVPILRFLVESHLAIAGPSEAPHIWGHSWQSAFWGSYIGRGAWWAWDDLPEDVQDKIRAVIASEAEFIAGQTPPTQLRRDTKAEENGWNSMIFNRAIVLMPDDPRRPIWEQAQQRWAMSSFLRPADERSSQIVDGRPVAEQFIGANIHDDFTLENHRIVHPHYMGAYCFTVGESLDFALTERKPPDAMFHNAQGIHDVMKWFFLPDGCIVYPNGQDWEVFLGPVEWSDLQIMMAVYAQDPDSWQLLQNSLATIEKMRARNPNGPLYVEEEVHYDGNQELAAEALARYWLMLQTAGKIVDKPHVLRGIKRLELGKIILNRTEKAIHTISWGPVVMAQCVPMRHDFLVSPDQRNGIGHIRLKGERRALPVRLHSANVPHEKDHAVADLVVHHGNAVKAELQFRSNADGTFVMKERLVALQDCTTEELNTGLIGILNDPKWVYQPHSRRIRLGETQTIVPSLSGKSLESQAVREIDVDGTLTIRSARPLSVRYLGARKIDRGRATDKLYLNDLGGERNWKRGETISSWEAIVSPVSDAIHTSEPNP